MSNEGVLFRLDPTTGEKMWRSDVGGGQIVALSPETAIVLRRSMEIEISLIDGSILD